MNLGGLMIFFLSEETTLIFKRSLVQVRVQKNMVF